MRKMISIFLLAVYSNAAMALGIDIQFCGERVTDVRLMGFGHACCAEKHHMPRGCCKNYVRFCHTHQNRNTSLVILNSQLKGNELVAPVLPANFITSLTACEPETSGKPSTNPLRYIIPDSCPLYIQNEVFRI